MVMNGSKNARCAALRSRGCLVWAVALQAVAATGCSRTDAVPKCETVACVRVLNQSAWDLNQVLLFRMDGSPTCLGPVANRSESPYQEVPSPLVSALKVEAYSDAHKFAAASADTVGAKPMAAGRYTLVLTIDEGNFRPRLSRD